MLTKIALGTVQFGLDYGINNDVGQVSIEEIERIINLCQQKGIKTIDTAHAYGNSEERLGFFSMDSFNVVSKLPPCKTSDVFQKFNASLTRLNIESMYGYMLHNFSIYERDKAVWDELKKLREAGKVSKIGVSLYSPQELETLWSEGVDLDIVQVPFNLFDQRFASYFEVLKELGVEIHTRSTFLQGLFFKDLNKLTPFFDPLKPKLKKLARLVKNTGLSKTEICLGWVCQNNSIDKVVIGVDSYKQCVDNVNKLETMQYKKLDWTLFNSFIVTESTLLNPSNWKKNKI